MKIFTDIIETEYNHKILFMKLSKLKLPPIFGGKILLDEVIGSLSNLIFLIKPKEIIS